MRIQKSVRIGAPADRVWRILGDEYADVGAWASAVYASAPRAGAPRAPGAPVLGRVCQTSLGPFVEAIESYDPERRHLAYSATGDKMPSFMKRLVNRWEIEPDGGASTVARMELTADIAFPFSVLMGWMIRRQFDRAVATTVEELKHFAETGAPHPRKRKVDGSVKARNARASFASTPTA